MSKLGLVLAGGGGKGSYQIGVWKYLREIGLDGQISVISGTSVGALNAFLIGCGDYEMAERIWLTEIEDKILDTESRSHKSGAFFSREGLLKIINENIKFHQDHKFPAIYVTCFNTKENKAEYIKLNGRPDEEITDYLLATSAIPIVFQKENINGRNYYDGGLKDNVPLKPLIDEGCTHALIINLNKNYHADYSGCGISTVVIHPSCDLGFFVGGTLDFSRTRAQIRMQLGYNDCKNLYSLKIKTLSGICEEKDLENMTEAEAISKTREINEMNDTAVLLETLKKISADPGLAGMVQVSMNAELETRGGKVFWNELAEFNGWKWQRNNIFGQVRLLDPLNNRRAWGKYQKVIDKCRNFLENEVRKELEFSRKYGNSGSAV